MKQIQLFAAFVIICAGLNAASSVVVPFLLAIFISVAVLPLMRILTLYRVPRSLAIVFLVAIFGTILWLLGGVLSNTISAFLADLPMYRVKFEGVIADLLEWLKARGVNTDANALISLNVERIFSSATGILKSTSEIVTKSFLVLLLVIFMLFEAPIFAKKFISFGDSASSVVGNFARNLTHYIAIKTTSSIATAAILSPALIYFNVPYISIWLFLAFALNYIPTVGSIVAAVPAICMCLLVNEPIYALYLAIIYLIVNIAIGNFIEPRFLGAGLGISTLAVVLSLIFWGFLLGIGGAFLAVPLTMSIKLALNENKQMRYIAVLLSDKA